MELTRDSKYKGTKIDWDVDECAQPYVLAPLKATKQTPQPKKATVANRFQLLNIDDNDDDDDDDEMVSAFRAKKVVGIAA